MTRSGWAILVAALACAGCATLDTPTRARGTLRATPLPAQVANASFDGLQLQCPFAIENTARVPLTLVAIDYMLGLEATRVAEGKVAHGTTIEPGARTTATVSVDLTFDTLRKAVPALATSPEGRYSLVATALFTTPQGREVRMPLAREGTLYALAPPRVEVARLAVRRRDVAAGRLDLVLRITNPNAFTAQVKQFACDVHLGGTRVGRIALTPNRAIAPGGTAELVGPLPLDFRTLGPALHAAIGSGAIAVRIGGSARVLTPYGEPTVQFDMTRKTPVLR